jgi:hypothetical protein
MFASKDVFFKASAAGGSPNRSLRVRTTTSYATRTPSSAGNRKTWTFATWVKMGNDRRNANAYIFGAGSTGQTYTALDVGFASFDVICLLSNSVQWRYASRNQTSSDTSGWRHICIAFDSTQATAADRVKIYINGVQPNNALWTIAGAPSLNFDDASMNNTVPIRIGQAAGPNSGSLDGYLAETYFIGGQALAPTSFCEYNSSTGELQPKAYTGSYGTNGFYLNYKDITSTTTLVQDASGSGNNFTPNNLSLTAGGTYDSFFDYPSNFDGSTYQNGNYMTLSMRDPRNTWAALPNNDGGLTVPGNFGTVRYMDSWFDLTTGKYYWEFTVGANTSSCVLSLFDGTTNYGTFNQPVSTTYGYRYDNTTGVYEYTSNGTSWTNITTVSFTSGLFYTLAVALTNSSNTPSYFNAGQRAFTYTPPSGYKTTCTQNAANPPLVPAQHFQSIRYLGNGATRTFTNTYNGVSSLSFQPDLAWIVGGGGVNPGIFSAQLGVNNYLITSGISSVINNTQTLTAFNSDGYTTGNASQVNGTGLDYSSFQWKAGNGTVTNTAGSTTSTVSANTSAGFSIVRYAGNSANSTVGHGLGRAPELMIIKSYSATFNWAVYFAPSGNTIKFAINLTTGPTTSAFYWNNTTPTNTVFSLGVSGDVNSSTVNYEAYCFASIPGYSKVGSYAATNSADGKFIPLGFKPAWILIKQSASSNWIFVDANMSWSINQLWQSTEANTAAAITSGNIVVTFNSTGFQLMDNGIINPNGTTTILYYAVAQTGFKYALGR